MTDAHYGHIQQLIRRELKGRFESSGWFALMLAAFGVATTILITVLGTDIPDAANKGKLETAGWFCMIFAAFCLAIHVVKRKDGEQRATDLIEMMDRYNIEVAQHDGKTSAGTDTMPAASMASPVAL
ncbi:MAG: hypothetical protein WAU77_10400 [Solirubrobacteraceae bacterium]